MNEIPFLSQKLFIVINYISVSFLNASFWAFIWVIECINAFKVIEYLVFVKKYLFKKNFQITLKLFNVLLIIYIHWQFLWNSILYMKRKNFPPWPFCDYAAKLATP